MFAVKPCDAAPGSAHALCPVALDDVRQDEPRVARVRVGEGIHARQDLRALVGPAHDEVRPRLDQRAEPRAVERGRVREDGGGGRREMFPATCSACGKETQVPFQPRGDKPVYCSNCFTPRQTSGYGGGNYR